MLCVGVMYSQDENTTYEQNGDLVEITSRYDNGQIEQHGFFKDKKLHGIWTYYNQEGKKMARGNYENGVKTGKWLFWNNKTLKEVKYLKGKVVNVKELSSDSSMAYSD